MAIAAAAGEIRVANAPKGPWENIPVPWGKQSEVLALSIDDNGRLKVALLDQAREVLSIWDGEPGQLTQILTQPATRRPLVGIWVPWPSAVDSTWYISLDQQLWEFGRPSTEGTVHAHLISEAPMAVKF